MAKKIWIAIITAAMPALAQGQRLCGYNMQLEALSKTYPALVQQHNAEKQALEQEATAYFAHQNLLANKTTATSAIPVIFHIVLDSAKLARIGGVAGVKARCDSQIAVLNMDYNRGNSDSTLIPSGWKPVYTSVGIRFGLAHTAPSGQSTPGYDIRVTSQNFAIGSTFDYPKVKDSLTGGTSTWDPEKYLNIWCMYFSDNPSLLGITTPYSWTSGASGLPAWHRGICVSYNSFGKRAAATDYFNSRYDRGRTLTHELGHYFGLRHTWGDDPAGSCPWVSGGSDDGISDTSPESDATYGNPVYSVTNGTLYDGCKFNGSVNMQPYGIPCLNFMDYTEDAAMHMFTKLQAGVMATRAIAPSGESYTLTQHPELLDYPTGVNDLLNESNLLIYPVPTKGRVNISYDESSAQLLNVTILNTLGQEVANINNLTGKANYDINLEGMTSGVYFVHCNFASGTIVRKIVLQ